MLSKEKRARYAKIIREYAEAVEAGEVGPLYAAQTPYEGSWFADYYTEVGMLAEVQDMLGKYCKGESRTEEEINSHRVGVFVPIFEGRWKNKRPACENCEFGYDFFGDLALDYVDEPRVGTDFDPWICEDCEGDVE